jgi:hypothetical protein
MIKFNKYVAFLLLTAAVLAGFVLYAPQFLLFSSNYEKADSIILLVGPDFNARKKGANRLIDEGMANFLIVPAHNKTYKIINNRIDEEVPVNLATNTTGKKAVEAPAFYYEDTHLEIIEAQKIMSNYESKSAIFISSPYHMRRIKLIASRVFDTKKGSFYFVPTRYEKNSAIFWEISLADWKKILRSCFKCYLWREIKHPFLFSMLPDRAS